jgi:Poly (ADP-ribose) glycohydrolase (PARG)
MLSHERSQGRAGIRPVKPPAGAQGSQLVVKKPRRRTRRVHIDAPAKVAHAGQRVIMPWDTSRWHLITNACERKITTPAEFEIFLSTVRLQRVKPKQIVELFQTYQQMDRPPRPYEDIFKAIAVAQQAIITGPRRFQDHSMRILTSGNITFNTDQTETMVACGWFGILDYDYISPGPIPMESFSDPNMGESTFILGALTCYFLAARPQRKIILRRAESQAIDWMASEQPIMETLLGELGAHHDDSCAHAIWAPTRDFIGGDLFTKTLTVDEVLIATRLDSFACVLMCPRLQDDAVLCFGAKKYCQYSGMGSSTRIQPYDDPTEGDEMTRTCMLFADATRRSIESQYTEFDRDLNKAFTVMRALPQNVQTVAVGPWQYGTNPSAHEVKFLQLLLAASACGKTLEYYSIGRDFEDYVEPFMAWLLMANMTVGELYELYHDCLDYMHSINTRPGELRLFELIMDA